MDVNYQLTIAVSTIVSECLPRTVSDYEQTIINLLEPEQSSDIKNKHLFILKATGLGLTELTLRYMVYLATRDNALANSTMCIVTGPRIDLAENLIQRIKNLFRTHLGACDIRLTRNQKYNSSSQ
jgi:late competence protein required for DNA uptake (superfamily II DNA/RNA helicase)